MADKAPTPKPAMKRPIVNWTMEYWVAVWMTTPAVKMAAQIKIEPRRPNLSEVNAWAMAPLYRGQSRVIDANTDPYTNVPAERREVIMD